MHSRRRQIEMTPGELRDFVREQMVMECATVGPRGLPHMVPLWYVPGDGELLSWTYAKSQKAKNLERDPRATIQVETGVQYHELRGVMMECDVELDDDAQPYGLALFERYAGTLDESVTSMVEQQAPKRVGLRFKPTRIVSWDHSKLGGTY
jgi:PPOX class probable F420-dependent enzyme